MLTFWWWCIYYLFKIYLASQFQCRNTAYSLFRVYYTICTIGGAACLRSYSEQKRAWWRRVTPAPGKCASFPTPSSQIAEVIKSTFVPLVQERNTFLSKVFMILEEFYWRPLLIYHIWPLYLCQYEQLLEGMLKVTISLGNSVNEL